MKRAALLRKSPIRKRSPKQAANLKEWARLKKEEIRRQLRESGQVVCASCGDPFYTEEKALAGLHADHIKSGHGREWTAENMQLLCGLKCHLQGKHGQ